jgi:hypothetical protein
MRSDANVTQLCETTRLLSTIHREIGWLMLRQNVLQRALYHLTDIKGDWLHVMKPGYLASSLPFMNLVNWLSFDR